MSLKGRRQQPKQIKVFISYATKDIDDARRLYDELKNASLDPWLDEESILPGQIKSITTKKAIRESRFFVALLSNNSVKERGDVQKQLRGAWDVFKEFPESDIYLIPARLDNCDIPYDELQDIQYVDLFPSWKEGLKKMLNAIGAKSGDSEENKPLVDNYLISLLNSIRDKRCTPIIGAYTSILWFPSYKNLAKKWTEEYDYPLESGQLFQISQFMAIQNENESFPKDVLKREIERTNLPNFSLEKYKNTPYAVLADLNLPVYITTNYDYFMEKALKDKGKDPVSEFCRWNDDLEVFSKRAGIYSVFDKPHKYKPTEARPLVYHLFGIIDIPESMVMNQSENMDFIINLNRKNDNGIKILPSIIQQALSTTSILVIGYSIEDMFIQLILRSIVKSLNIKFQINNIAIMDVSVLKASVDKINEAKSYVNKYSKDILKMHIYWESIDIFATKLRTNWEEFMSQE